MNSKVDQLENQQDLVDELTDFFKNLKKRKQKDKEITFHENRNKFMTNTNIIESDKKLREKINIEIDLNQRTTVYSNDHSMWV
jgi:hypothetical protein